MILVNGRRLVGLGRSIFEEIFSVGNANSRTALTPFLLRQLTRISLTSSFGNGPLVVIIPLILFVIKLCLLTTLMQIIGR